MYKAKVIPDRQVTNPFDYYIQDIIHARECLELQGYKRQTIEEISKLAFGKDWEDMLWIMYVSYHNQNNFINRLSKAYDKTRQNIYEFFKPYHHAIGFIQFYDVIRPMYREYKIMVAENVDPNLKCKRLKIIDMETGSIVYTKELKQHEKKTIST